jgi:hypothetical protein
MSKLKSGRNQNVMRLVLIKLITAGGIERKGVAAARDGDYSERNSPLQLVSSIILRDFVELACCPVFS